MKTLRFASIIVAILLLSGKATWAANGPAFCNPSGYDQRLDRRYEKDSNLQVQCIAGSSVSTRADAIRDAFYKRDDVTQKNNASPDAATNLTVWPETARAQLENIQSTAKAALEDGSESFKNAVVRFTQALSTLVTDSVRLKTVADWSTPGVEAPAELLPDYWKVKSTGDGPGSLPAQYLDAEKCLDSEPSAHCDAIYAQAIVLADQVYLVEKVISTMASMDRANFVKLAATREKRWHAYLYDTQFQYWWELGINRYVESKCPGFLAWECTRPSRDKYDNEVGFRDAPSKKFMILHPDIGLEYLNHEPAGQKFKPAIIFQWVGYQSWDWDNDDVARNKGISLVTSVADTSRTKRFGTGLQFQWKKYSVAVTSHGGDVGISINLNLIDWIGTVNKNWADDLMKPLPK